MKPLPIVTALVLSLTAAAPAMAECFVLSRPLVWEGCNLQHFPFAAQPDLSGARLSGSILSGLNLFGANFSNADLSNANLSRSDFSFANFSGANLSGANMQDGDFRNANFTGANLTGAQLEGAYFFWRDLDGWAGVHLERVFRRVLMTV